MDFRELARRQLQALCKRNKIPANLSNVAMVDALSALDNVEGLEEIMQPQSLAKADAGSPEVPRTVTRTSTRARKPPSMVLESGGTMSKSISGTSRKLVVEESVEDEKKDVVKTPAVVSSRKRAPAAASRRKVEVPSVQKVYSTRRSVRLVEKQLSELCLGESKKRTRPIKIDNELCSEMTESDVKGASLKLDASERNSELLNSYEVNSYNVSAHLVETLETAVVQGSKVSTDAIAFEEVEKVIYEACAMEAVVAMGNADSDAEKDLKIVSNGVSNLGNAVLVEQALPVSESQIVRDGVFDLLVKEEVDVSLPADHDGEFDLATKVEVNFKTSAGSVKVDEAVNEVTKKGTRHGINAELLNDEINSNNVSSHLEETVDTAVVQDSKVSTDAIASEEVENAMSEVCAEEAVETMGNADFDGEFDLATKVEVTFKPAGSVNVDKPVNEERKKGTEHDSDMPVSSVDGDSEHNAELGVTEAGSGILNAMESVIVEANDSTFQADESNHDADRMGSPFHLSDHIDYSADDFKPQNSMKNSIHPMEQRVNMECLEDTEEVLDSTEPKLQSLQRSATGDVNKENTARSLVSEECFNNPKTPYADMSMRRLQKMLKGLKIDPAKETVKHQHTTIPRQALKTLPDNTQI